MKKTLSLLGTLVLALTFSSCNTNEKENPDANFDEFMQESGQEEWISNDLTTNEKEMQVDQLEAPAIGDKIAVIETSKWEIKVKLFPEATPKTYENFVGLAEKGYYNGTIFHRVIPDFMVQGGDPTGTGMWGESFFGKDFEDEPHPGLKNVRGALSMANKGPNTNGSQFFIVQAEETSWLDGYQNWVKTCGQLGTSCHTVFGQVFEWMEVVDQISSTKTDQMDKPLEEIKIKSVKIEEYK